MDSNDSMSSGENILHLKGLQFEELNDSRIKFRFFPAEHAKYVVYTIRFKCVLKYTGKYWLIKRDSFPVNYKWRIYKLFWGPRFLRVTNDNVFEVIKEIYEILIGWAQQHSNYRRRKFARYLAFKSDVELDSDDEKLFLTPEQREERARKTRAVLARMIPPERRRPIHKPARRPRLQYQSDSSSTDDR